MTARWEDPHYDAPSWLERLGDRLADWLYPAPTDPLADAVRREAMIAHPSNALRGTAGEAPRLTHGTAGRRGANHRTVGPMRLTEFDAWVTDDGTLVTDETWELTITESPSRTALGITVAFLAVVGLVLAAVSCDPNPATSLGCADDSCEVQG